MCAESGYLCWEIWEWSWCGQSQDRRNLCILGFIFQPLLCTHRSDYQELSYLPEMARIVLKRHPLPKWARTLLWHLWSRSGKERQFPHSIEGCWWPCLLPSEERGKDPDVRTDRQGRCRETRCHLVLSVLTPPFLQFGRSILPSMSQSLPRLSF